KERYKGYIHLLDAAEVVWRTQPETRFVFIGIPGFYSSFFDEFARYADERIVDIERASGAERSAALDACDVFAMPSLHETFGIGYLEAWLHERPVVGGDIPALREVIAHGADGLLARPRARDGAPRARSRRHPRGAAAGVAAARHPRGGLRGAAGAGHPARRRRALRLHPRARGPRRRGDRRPRADDARIAQRARPRDRGRGGRALERARVGRSPRARRARRRRGVRGDAARASGSALLRRQRRRPRAVPPRRRDRRAHGMGGALVPPPGGALGTRDRRGSEPRAPARGTHGRRDRALRRTEGALQGVPRAARRRGDRLALAPGGALRRDRPGRLDRALRAATARRTGGRSRRGERRSDGG